MDKWITEQEVDNAFVIFILQLRQSSYFCFTPRLRVWASVPSFRGTCKDKRRKHVITKKLFLTLDFDDYHLGRKNTLRLSKFFPHLRWEFHKNHHCCCFQSLNHLSLFVTPWIAAHQASLSFTISQSLLKLMSIESVIPSNHLAMLGGKFNMLYPYGSFVISLMSHNWPRRKSWVKERVKPLARPRPYTLVTQHFNQSPSHLNSFLNADEYSWRVIFCIQNCFNKIYHVQFFELQNYFIRQPRLFLFGSGMWLLL